MNPPVGGVNCCGWFGSNGWKLGAGCGLGADALKPCGCVEAGAAGCGCIGAGPKLGAVGCNCGSGRGAGVVG